VQITDSPFQIQMEFRSERIATPIAAFDLFTSLADPGIISSERQQIARDLTERFL